MPNINIKDKKTRRHPLSGLMTAYAIKAAIPAVKETLTQSAQWVNNNKAKVTVITTGVVETVSVAITGEIPVLPEPKPIDAMFESPNIDIIKDIKNIAKPIEGAKPIAGSNFELIKVKTFSSSLNTPASDVFDITNEINPFTLMSDIMPQQFNSNSCVPDLIRDLPVTVNSLSEANRSVLQLNAIIMLKAAKHYVQTEQETQKILHLVNSFRNIYGDNNDYNYWVAQFNKDLSARVENMSNVTLKAHFQTIIDNNKEYFDSLSTRLNNLPQIQNETTNAFEQLRDSEKAAERLLTALEAEERSKLLLEIKAQEDYANSEITRNMETIKGRSEVMLKKLLSETIPSIEKNYEEVNTLVKDFKFWVLKNKILSMSLSMIALVSASLYFYRNNQTSVDGILSFVKKIIWGANGVTKNVTETVVSENTSTHETLLETLKSVVKSEEARKTVTNLGNATINNTETRKIAKKILEGLKK